MFSHALIGGLLLTRSMRDELDARNIRLIMVWRPYFAGSDPDGVHKKAPERFARDIEYLLDHLNIETCQILRRHFWRYICLCLRAVNAKTYFLYRCLWRQYSDHVKNPV